MVWRVGLVMVWWLLMVADDLVVRLMAVDDG